MAKANNKGGGGPQRTTEKAMTPAGEATTKGEVAAAAADAPARPRVGPFKFASQVRQEVMKVTWPTRQETVVTTIMVFIMVILAAIFFALVDTGLGSLRNYLLSLLG
jgi:preprotein translocase subunit SecE